MLVLINIAEFAGANKTISGIMNINKILTTKKKETTRIMPEKKISLDFECKSRYNIAAVFNYYKQEIKHAMHAGTVSYINPIHGKWCISVQSTRGVTSRLYTFTRSQTRKQTCHLSPIQINLAINNIII